MDIVRVTLRRGKESRMGDKGKKDKVKGEKQKGIKKDHADKEKRDHVPKRKD